MRLLTTSLAISLAAVLAFACDVTDEPDSLDIEMRAGNGKGRCKTDDDCGLGTVCEPAGPGCNTNKQSCVAGCHEDADCSAGEYCNQVACFTCPCPGICEPDNSGCASDDECPAGTVCELDGPGCGPGSSCVPGCHEDADCSAGETCNTIFCFTCPCPGMCG